MNRRPLILRASVTLLTVVLVTACDSIGLDLGDDTMGVVPRGALSAGLQRVDATITLDEGRLHVAGRSDDLVTGNFVLDEPDVTPDVLFRRGRGQRSPPHRTAEGAGPRGRRVDPGPL